MKLAIVLLLVVASVALCQEPYRVVQEGSSTVFLKAVKVTDDPAEVWMQPFVAPVLTFRYLGGKKARVGDVEECKWTEFAEAHDTHTDNYIQLDCGGLLLILNGVVLE